MVIDKLKITYNLVSKAENEDGTVTVTATPTTDLVHVKRLKFRRRAQLFVGLKGDAKEVDDQIPADRQANFTVAMISESVCDRDGKMLFTADDVDDWEDNKRNAYFAAIVQHQSPGLEKTAKNSLPTPNVAT